jgi:hypothetical protein
MFAVVQKIFGFAFTIAWIRGAGILAFRWRAKQRAYLGRFPPVDAFPLDAPLDRFLGMNPFGKDAGALREAAWQQQRDPELERLRREVWCSYRAIVLWAFGLPVVVFGTILRLTITGVLLRSSTQHVR